MCDLGQVRFPLWAPGAISVKLEGRISVPLRNSYALGLLQLVTHSEGYPHTQKQETKLEMLNGWQSLRQGKLWGEKG